jgi:hypothetical protein
MNTFINVMSEICFDKKNKAIWIKIKLQFNLII